MIKLPNPKKKGDLSLEEVINNRRTRRELIEEGITLEDLSQLLWAAQGITDPGKVKKTAPSAGARYPYEILISVTNVEGLDSGLYRYLPQKNTLEALNLKINDKLKKAAFDQGFLDNSAVDIILTADYKKTTEKYKNRGVRYVHIEAGHIAQNICLQAEALGLGSVLVGAFDDDKIKEILGLEKRDVTYILSIGRYK